jgi:hypothetical protein
MLALLIMMFAAKSNLSLLFFPMQKMGHPRVRMRMRRRQNRTPSIDGGGQPPPPVPPTLMATTVTIARTIMISY